MKTFEQEYARAVDRKSQQTAYTLDEYDAAIVRFLDNQGFSCQRIAALFDVNQGRVSEVITGQRLPGNTLAHSYHLKE